MFRIREADAADVEARPIGEVKLPKAESILDSVELRDAVLVEARERVSLGTVLGRARRPRSPRGGQPHLGLSAHRVKAREHDVEDGLLGVDSVRIVHGALPFASEAAEMVAIHYAKSERPVGPLQA